MSDRTTFQLSQDGQLLEARIIDRFRDRRTDADYVLSYDELNKLIGGDVQRDTALSTKLTAAVRRAARRLDIALGRDPNRGGVVLIPPGQYTGYMDRQTAKIRRAAKRTASEARRIAQHDGLDDQQRSEVYARGAVCGAIAAFGSRKAVAAAEQATRQDNSPISLARTIEAFRGAGSNGSA